MQIVKKHAKLKNHHQAVVQALHQVPEGAEVEILVLWLDLMQQIQNLPDDAEAEL